jgi:glycosyltransferase involved in cell wall biosynthesis
MEDSVHLLGRFPSEAMPSFFSKADVMLISLKDVSIFNLTVPAKLQAYMAAGKPIVAMMNGEGPRIISDAQCGCSVPAGDSKQLAKVILEMSQTDKNVLQQKGSNAKRYQIENFNIDRCMLMLESLLSQ